MGDSVGATLTKTIACSVCERTRHVCIADENEGKCLSAMNYEVKHGLCGHCEDKGLEQEESSPTFQYRYCKYCHGIVHPGAFSEHMRKHELARKEGMWAGKVRSRRFDKQPYRQDW